MTDRIDPRKVFYLALPIWNLDGTVEIDVEENATFRAEGEAIEHATNSTDRHGGEFVICQCTPIKRVYRPKVSVETIESPTRQRSRRAKDKTPAPQSNGTSPDPLAAAREVVEAEKANEPPLPLEQSSVAIGDLDGNGVAFLKRQKAGAV